MYVSHDRPLRLSRLSLYTLTDFMAPAGATPSAMLDSRYCKLKEKRGYVQQYTHGDHLMYVLLLLLMQLIPFFRQVCMCLLPCLSYSPPPFSLQIPLNSLLTTPSPLTPSHTPYNPLHLPPYNPLSTHSLTHSPQTPSTYPLTTPSPLTPSHTPHKPPPLTPLQPPLHSFPHTLPTNPLHLPPYNPLSTHSLTHSPQTPSTYPLTNPSPPIILLHKQLTLLFHHSYLHQAVCVQTQQ